MTVELIKQLLDACYLAKRARDMLPALPDGVMPSYIRYLDTIGKLQAQGIHVKVSDISDALNLPRPGVTRTVKEMVERGYLEKEASTADGRVTYLSVTEAGQALSREYDADFFRQLSPYMEGISDEDAECTIRTLEKFHAMMLERRDSHEASENPDHRRRHQGYLGNQADQSSVMCRKSPFQDGFFYLDCSH